MRLRPPFRLALLAPLLLATAACTEFLETVPPRPVASEDAAVAEAEYPRLAQVPERPRLGYALEQQREIAEGLVADRDNARYAGDTLRRDTGRPVQPDMPAPLPPIPPPPVVADDSSGDLALAYIKEALAKDSDDGSLGDFLDRLEQPPPGAATAAPAAAEPTAEDGPIAKTDEVADAPAEPRPAPPAPAAPVAKPGDSTTLTTAATPAAAAPAEDATPADVAPASVIDDTVPADVAALSRASPAAPALPMTIRFPAGAVEVGAADRQRAEALAAAADGRSVLVVSGGGPRAGLAMERARRVAAILVAAGVDAQRIAIEMAGEGDAVVVYEAAGEAG